MRTWPQTLLVLFLALWLPTTQTLALVPAPTGLPHSDNLPPTEIQLLPSRTVDIHRVHLYTGEQMDPDLGFYYLRARYHNPDSGRFWTMDEYGGRNGEPQTLHKYLYCHANPANSIDPSGNMTLNELQTTATALLVLAIKVAVPTFAVLYGYDVLDHILGGSKPTLGQRIQLAEARALLSNSTLPSHLDSKRGIALTANIRVYPEGKLGRWAETRPFGHPFGWNTIKVEETVFKLSPGLLAATLMHESVHTGQWSPIAFPGCSMERSAYQVESDFLRAIGLTGEKYWSPALLSRFPTSEDENWLRDSAMDYDSLGTSNAAVSR